MTPLGLSAQEYTPPRSSNSGGGGGGGADVMAGVPLCALRWREAAGVPSALAGVLLLVLLPALLPAQAPRHGGRCFCRWCLPAGACCLPELELELELELEPELVEPVELELDAGRWKLELVLDARTLDARRWTLDGR